MYVRMYVVIRFAFPFAARGCVGVVSASVVFFCERIGVTVTVNGDGGFFSPLLGLAVFYFLRGAFVRVMSRVCLVIVRVVM